MSKENAMLAKSLIVVMTALLLSSCATTTTPSEAELLARANETVDTSAVATEVERPPMTRPLLAIEVEVTADGVKPIGATIVHAHPRPNSAFGDLRVQAVGSDWTYTLPDPRIVEGDDPNEPEPQVLESARAFIFIPLIVAVSGVSIQPLADSIRDRVSRGGEFDVRAFAAEACQRTRSPLPVCREILANSTR